MKRILLFVSVVAASLLISAGSALTDEDYLQIVSPPKGAQKDECLLVARNCPDEALSLQQRIDKLNIEISKGTNAYTVDELSILRKKLDDANKTMEFIRIEGY